MSRDAGSLALANFALKCSVALQETANGYKTNSKIVRDLREELESLNEVLRILSTTINTKKDAAEFAVLEIPLWRCGKACQDLEESIIKYTWKLGDGNMSPRDWARITYMGEDIDGFRQMVAGYKSTITIALGGARLRTSSVTTNVMDEYKEMIVTTMGDLEAHLKLINEKVEEVVAKDTGELHSEPDEIQLIKEEQLSSKTCLEIMARYSLLIEHSQRESRHNDSVIQPTTSKVGIITDDALQECKMGLAETTAKLERKQEDLMNQLLLQSKIQNPSVEEAAQFAKLQEELETIRQCTGICSKAIQNSGQGRMREIEELSQELQLEHLSQFRNKEKYADLVKNGGISSSALIVEGSKPDNTSSTERTIDSENTPKDLHHLILGMGNCESDISNSPSIFSLATMPSTTLTTDTRLTADEMRTAIDELRHGKQLYDDYVEHESGALEGLQDYLDATTVPKKTIAPSEHGQSPSLAAFLYTPNARSTQTTTPLTSVDIADQSITNTTRLLTSNIFQHIEQSTKTTRPLLLLACIKRRGRPAKLHQKFVTHIEDDRQLFHALRKIYFDHRRRLESFWSLRTLHSIHFMRS
ncbi:hypothetical protein PENDEC_c046G04162 [Penicillium decumbens]|uniref:Azaphilone pigments biosynthesis cluster protein L N-terminal domain-containing protein n=1 Tax=Penicillium decumbens TaxID=69771 RepID=A0A1V6NQU2_PENDC|nr:hypothetical protein PENDEC_c046G04162 [Penicillium decumbens]